MSLTNYVKFLRGTPSQFERLSVKDKDTLYFISEADAAVGSLYLGSKLIAGGTDLSKSSIKDLADIVITEASLTDGSILAYDYASQTWVNKSLDEVLVDVMQGATESTAGTAGLVPAPLAGDQDKFLKGDGTWATVIASIPVEDKEDISNLKATVATLVGADADKSIREIATDALTQALIPDGAKESLDTLKEIADWIQSHPDDVATINSEIATLKESNTTLITKVGNLETILNGDGADNQGLINKVNSLFNADGSDKFVLKTVYAAQVGDYNQLNHSTENSSIIDEINSINERISWQEMQ